jgi:hypothetical protein
MNNDDNYYFYPKYIHGLNVQMLSPFVSLSLPLLPGLICLLGQAVGLVNCCWPSPVQSFLVPRPTGLMTHILLPHNSGCSNPTVLLGHVRCLHLNTQPVPHRKHTPVSITTTNQFMLFIVRIIWNTQIHCVGRMQSFLILKRTVHILTNAL